MKRPPLEDIQSRYCARTGTDQLIRRIIAWAWNREAKVAELKTNEERLRGVNIDQAECIKRQNAQIRELEAERNEALNAVCDQVEEMSDEQLRRMYELGGERLEDVAAKMRSLIERALEKAELKNRVAELEGYLGRAFGHDWRDLSWLPDETKEDGA